MFELFLVAHPDTETSPMAVVRVGGIQLQRPVGLAGLNKTPRNGLSPAFIPFSVPVSGNDARAMAKYGCSLSKEMSILAVRMCKSKLHLTASIQ